MKRLLLAPLLLGLLISNSALAGRPNLRNNLKKEAENQKQEEYLVLCNQNNNWKNACSKVSKINRNRITNEKFINARKDEAIKTLEKCTVLRDTKQCENLASNTSKYLKSAEEIQKLSWLGREITMQEKKIMRDLADQHMEERKRLIEEWDKGKEEREKMKKEREKEKKEKEVRVKNIVRLCERLIIKNLKDPDSYRRLNTRDNQIATGFIRYSATNSFGGRVQEVFKCFDPENK